MKYFVKESNDYPRKVSSLSEKEVQQANEFVKHSLKEAPSESRRGKYQDYTPGDRASIG